MTTSPFSNVHVCTYVRVNPGKVRMYFHEPFLTMPPANPGIAAAMNNERKHAVGRKKEITGTRRNSRPEPEPAPRPLAPVLHLEQVGGQNASNLSVLRLTKGASFIGYQSSLPVTRASGENVPWNE